MTKGTLDDADRLKMQDAAAIGLSYQVHLDKASQRTVVFQTHVPQASTAEDINKIMDLGYDVTSRQADRYEIKEIEQQILMGEKHLEWAGEDLIRIDKLIMHQHEISNRKGDPQARGNQARERENVVQNIAKLKKDIDWSRGLIKKIKDKHGLK